MERFGQGCTMPMYLRKPKVQCTSSGGAAGYMLYVRRLHLVWVLTKVTSGLLSITRCGQTTHVDADLCLTDERFSLYPPDFGSSHLLHFSAGTDFLLNAEVA
jgi:hypothetical protein